MDVVIGWLGLGIGLAGCIVTYLMLATAGPCAASDAGKRRSRWVAGVTLLTALIFWAISMQQRTPFSTGQTLGLGFLIGGISGSIAILLGQRLAFPHNDSARLNRLAVHSIMFFALFDVSLVYLIFHGNPHWALIGFSIGAVMAAILSRAASDDAALGAIHIEMWAVFGISIAVGIVLAAQHFDQSALRIWWSLPILLAVTVMLASFVCAELRLSRFLSTLISVFLTIGLSAIYSWRIVEDWSLLGVVAAGIAAAAIISWVTRSLNRAGDRSYGLEAASASALLVVAFIVAAFKLWAGLGIDIGLIAAWSIALQLFDTADPSSADASDGMAPVSYALHGALSLGLMILLFKVFGDLYRPELGNTDLRIHYTFIGALLGIILPLIFASAITRQRQSSTDMRVLAGIALIGLVSAVAPILLYLVWGIKVVLGLVFGVTASAAFLYILRLSRECEGGLLRNCSVGLLVIGMQLSAIEFVRPLVDLDLTRYTRIWILSGAVLIVALWFVVAGILAARREA